MAGGSDGKEARFRKTGGRIRSRSLLTLSQFRIVGAFAGYPA
jgi:hypothetical protein